MTPVEPDEQGKTARIEHQPAPASSPSLPSASPVATPLPDPTESAEPAAEFASPVSGVIQQVARQPETVFVPLAVNVGDGFKFGCGFFLALVLAMLIGFVLVAALFVLSGLFGLNPMSPLSR